MSELWELVRSATLGALAGLMGELLALLIVLAPFFVIAVVTYFVLRGLGVDVRVTSRKAPGAHRFSFDTKIADPLVYRLDAAGLERARRRLDAGEDLDAICSDVEPAYATWGTGQREAFRRLLMTALEEESAL